MRRFLLAALLLCVPLTALAIGLRSWDETPSGTRSAPTSVLEGMALSEVTGFRVVVKPTSGTITTACTLRAYVWSETATAWATSAASSSTARYTDWKIDASDIGKAAIVFPDQQPVSRRGRVLYAPDGCQSNLHIYIEAVTL